MSYIEAIAHRIRAAAYADRSIPEAENDDDLYLFYAILVLTVGEAVTQENVHDAWAAWASLKQPQHSSLRPFSQLSDRARLRDERFRRAIVEVARAHAGAGSR